MLNNLQQLAAPYTQWLMGHRNAVIILLAFTLFLESCALLIARWRVEKVTLDLDAAKRAAVPAPRPAYLLQRTPGEIPPVRGGMTYARNLGPALERVYGPPAGAPPAPMPPPPGYRDHGLPPPGSWPEAPSPYSTPPAAFPPPPPYPGISVTAPGPAFGTTPPPPYYPPPPPLAPAPAPILASTPAPLPVQPVIVEPTPPAAAVAEPAAPASPPTASPASRLKRWLPRIRARLAPAPEASVEQAAPAPPPPPAEMPLPSAGPHVQALEPTDTRSTAEEAPAEVARPGVPMPRSRWAAAAPAPAARVKPMPEEISEASPAAPDLQERAEAVAAPEILAGVAETVPATPADEVEESVGTKPPRAPADEEPAPVTTAADADGSSGAEGDGPSSDNSRTVLLIEDDESVAKYYSMLFEARGYAVAVATDGVQGVDMATRIRPGLILLDVMMPRQNGMMVLQTLCATPATEETPIVILSNFTEPTLIQRALQLGAVEYVVKTQVKAEALANAVPKWMHRERAFA